MISNYLTLLVEYISHELAIRYLRNTDIRLIVCQIIKIDWAQKLCQHICFTKIVITPTVEEFIRAKRPLLILK